MSLPFRPSSFRFRFPLLLAGLLLFAAASGLRAEPTPVPVLVIVTYETGADRGDVPGELQYWVEREHLDQSIAVPGVLHPLLTNGRGLYVMVSGTTSRSALQVMALGIDPRFDLRKTYFLVAGIAGGDPETTSLGSAAWATHVVDGNPAFEIDAREIPAGWPHGLVAYGTNEPGKVSRNVEAVPAPGTSENGAGGVGTVGFTLNPGLAAWAYALTKDTPLPDDDGMKAYRAHFSGHPVAQRPPFVQMGVSLACDRFWHGDLQARWARDWVRLYTRGAGTFAMSNCEDAGICLALQELQRLDKVDFSRLLVLRTACNFISPPPGFSAADSLFGKTLSESSGTGYLPSLESAYRIGSIVTAELLKNQDRYREHAPEAP
jgi:purine nucleoside permease